MAYLSQVKAKDWSFRGADNGKLTTKTYLYSDAKLSNQLNAIKTLTTARYYGGVSRRYVDVTPGSASTPSAASESDVSQPLSPTVGEYAPTSIEEHNQRTQKRFSLYTAYKENTPGYAFGYENLA